MDCNSTSTSPQPKPHLLLVPLPQQGHVAPFKKLAHQLASHGAKVTIFTTEFIHVRIAGGEVEDVRIVSIPDGLAPGDDDNKDESQIVGIILKVIHLNLGDWIKKANEQEKDGKISCIAGKMGLKQAALFTAPPKGLASILNIPKLIDAGILDANDGSLKKEGVIHLSPNTILAKDELFWNIPGNKSQQASAFHHLLLVSKTLMGTNWPVLCNWFPELDVSGDCLAPNMIPVGPLLASGQPSANLWSEDCTCLSWLDKQTPGSVIYVAFGSTTKFTQQQFDELALGLELVGQPFLWVVRPDLSDGFAPEYPNGFKDRVANLGKVVHWAPQEKVLAHPSTACYLVHCGWNSTVEAISMGKPMLCWPPYRADHFYNRNCICYGWKIGLELKPDENGTVTRHELKRKVDKLLSDDGIKENVLKFKQLAQKNISRGGSSSKNLEEFSSPKSCSNKANPHVLLLTLPAQGHVGPMMKLGYHLADYGVKVTFFTTETMHEKLVRAISPPKTGGAPHPKQQQMINIVSFPDGLGEEDERITSNSKDLESIIKVLPGHVQDLIKANQSEEENKFTCVIADLVVGWAIELGRKMGLKGALFIPVVPGVLSLVLQISELIEAGIIDEEGHPRNNKKIQLSPYLPAMANTDYVWYNPGDKLMEKIGFEMVRCSEGYIRGSNWVLCNWFHDLDPSADDLLPNTLPVGPLLAKDHHPGGNSWSEDLTCLTWLDRHPPGSVVYVAFGSLRKLSQHQFDELALGLESMSRPFLWVVRLDFIDGVLLSGGIKYPDGFQERIGDLGKIVNWAPQEKVLAHPSVGCFLTHCGWNSALEGLSMGVPMLCWPTFGDHLYDRTCICEGWKIGLDLNKEEDGLVTRQEIIDKVNELLSSDGIRANALKMRRLALRSIGEGGSSSKNLED
ncbi:hypothetical protein Tsubulata_009065, partial [Turnera subulata]